MEPFRTKQEPTKEPEIKAVNTHADTTTSVESPYLEYERENSRPFIANYFQLGDTWADPNGGFAPEVSLLEEFIENRIKKGELNNSVNAVKEVMNKMSRITNLTKEDSPIKKIETLAAYVKFLMTTDKISFNLKRYASH